MLKQIVAVIIAVLVMVGAYFCNGLFGNPVSKALVTKNAKEYVEEKYAADGYAVEDVRYDFKTGSYYVDVRCPDSLDKYFTLYGGFDGKIDFDTYDSAVDKKWNTASRIDGDYRKAAEAIFSAENFPYSSDITFGVLIFAESDSAVGNDAPEYAILTDSLELDGEYDIYELGKRAGCLTVYVEDDMVSAGRLSVILLRLKEAAEKEKVGFRAVNCVLQHPMDENYEREEGTVTVLDFPYDEIYERDLTARIKAADAEAKAYYAAEDELKSQGDC